MLKLVNKLVNKLFGRTSRSRHVEDTSLLSIFNQTYGLDEFAELLKNTLHTWLLENSELKEFDELDRCELHCIAISKVEEYFPGHCTLVVETDLLSDPFGVQYYYRTNQPQTCLIIKSEFKHPELPKLDKLYMYWLISLYNRKINTYKYYLKEESGY